MALGLEMQAEQPYRVYFEHKDLHLGDSEAFYLNYKKPPVHWKVVESR